VSKGRLEFCGEGIGSAAAHGDDSDETTERRRAPHGHLTVERDSPAYSRPVPTSSSTAQQSVTVNPDTSSLARRLRSTE
jgi:hypothetical protein